MKTNRLFISDATVFGGLLFFSGFSYKYSEMFEGYSINKHRNDMNVSEYVLKRPDGIICTFNDLDNVLLSKNHVKSNVGGFSFLNEVHAFSYSYSPDPESMSDVFDKVIGDSKPCTKKPSKLDKLSEVERNNVKKECRDVLERYIQYNPER